MSKKNQTNAQTDNTSNQKQKITKNQNQKKESSKIEDKQKQFAYIFDANFFISLKNVNAANILESLKQAKSDIGVKYFISNKVFAELPFYQGAMSKQFQDIIEVKLIDGVAIEKIKQDLTAFGIMENRHAQDPDLSLIALGKLLNSSNYRVFLVSDDFKLGDNLLVLKLPIEYQSLSAFLLFLSKNVKSPQLGDYFKTLHKNVLKYNLEYMLERKETYNPINKLMFLIENSIQISGDGFDLAGIDRKLKEKVDSSSRFQNICIDDVDAKDETAERIQNICENYIHEDKFDEIDEIILMIPLLDDIKKSRKLIASAKDALKDDQIQVAVRSLKSATNVLMQSLQIAGSLLPTNQFLIFQKVTSTELSNVEFLRSFLYISLDKLNNALESLESTAMYATMGRVKRSVIAINYLKALIYTFNKLYNEAIEQYKFTENLAINYAVSEQIILKCSIGRAVTMFLAGMQSEAIELIAELSIKIQGETIENAIVVFLELGDYFYAIGNPKIAIALYKEALECAIDSNEFNYKVNGIVEKMKKAYINASLETESKSDAGVGMFLDNVHELINIDAFNDAISQLAVFNAMIYKDLNYSEKGKTIDYFKLEAPFREKFDVFDILEAETSDAKVFIGYNKNIGLIGFRVKLLAKLAGTPENYTLKLKKNAKVQLNKPSDKLKAKYLLRGIIVVDENQIEIDRNIPVFFAQMNI